MKTLLAILLIASIAIPASAQVWLLDDEFNDASTLSNWSRFYATEDWPDRMRVVDINTTDAGMLYMEPTSTGWYNDLHAPFLYKTVSGDFVVETRLRTRGISGPLPATTYSLAGLFVRAPRKITSATWTAGDENWLFFSVGVGNDVNAYSFEDKSTVNSVSNLTVTATPGHGFVKMRVTRQGSIFTLDYRWPNSRDWVTHRVFNRADLPDTLQVGLTAYCDWPTVEPYISDPMTGNSQVLDVNADLRVTVDYIRFSNPVGVSADTPSANALQLDQNYPNPFNPSTSIRFQTEVPGHVTLVVYNSRGESVRTLVDNEMVRGSRRVTWNGRNDRGIAVASGVYYYRLSHIGGSQGVSRTRKLVLLK